MIPIAKPLVEDEEINAVLKVLKTGMLAQGPKVKELEELFFKLTNFNSIAIVNGTAALHTLLLSFGIGQGDEVITTPFTFAATATSIAMTGAKPVFVDINEDDYLIDVSKIESVITSKTKAILAVNIFGQCANYSKLNEIAKKHNLIILEDAAQSIGASQNGIVSGSLGDGAAFSLYATKNIMSGEGGMITVKDSSIAEKCRKLRHHGQGERYEYEFIGYNYRMTDLIAAIGVEQMKKMEFINSKRIENAELYDSLLSDVKGIIVPYVVPGNVHVYHQYAIRVSEEFPLSRDELKELLFNNSIGTGIHYPKPLHLHKAFEYLGYSSGSFPIAEKVSSEILSLPVHPFVSSEDINKIVSVIKNA